MTPDTSLHLPSSAFTSHVDITRLAARVEPAVPPEEILCSDLGEFISSGIARWRELLENMEFVIKIGAQIGEMHNTHKATTVSGRVIDGSTQHSFNKFAPLPEEILAVERIAQAATHLVPTALPFAGQYA